MGEAGNRRAGRRALPSERPVDRPTIGVARRPVGWTIAAASFIAVWASAAPAETMQSALVKAYQNNPQLNAQRANARSIDENVPQALSGYRPKLSVTAGLSEQYISLT